MSRRARADQNPLTDYEAGQVDQIAAWKSQPPNPIAELWKTITTPGASALEKVIPSRVVEKAIARMDTAADLMAGQEHVKRRAGVTDLAELRDRPLQDCDEVAWRDQVGAQFVATVEGAATGAGGVWTTLIDIPLLFTLAVRTIRRIGHCYGYALEGPQGRAFVLGVLVAALSGSLEIRRRRLERLRDVEDLLIEETEEDILVEEIVSFIFQLEVFEDVPGVGAISGAALNVAFMNRVNQTARRVFQERWLRDNRKVDVIEPAEVHPRFLVSGISGAFGRLAYSGCYAVGFGAAMPVFAVAAVAGSMSNARARGIRDGARAATDGVEQTRGRAREAAASREMAGVRRF